MKLYEMEMVKRWKYLKALFTNFINENLLSG